jgi:4-amino-4-deoxy-L-arabinose transferase-like glycosyltransferase
MAKHLLLWGIGSVVLWLAWTGFVASDDAYYVTAGQGWLNQFPYVGDHFGTARTVVTIPMGLAFALFGDSEFSASLPGCLFLLGTASVTMAGLAPLIGTGGSLAVCAVMLTLPLLALKATIPSADLPELFFAACSFWLFWRASQRQRRRLLLLAAGGSAGLAFLAHETAAALSLFYGLLFALGVALPRRQYWLMAGGFLAVVGLECLYFWAVAGDPLHRIALAAGAAVSTADRVEVARFGIGAGGTLHVWGPVDPILMFFTKQEFALLGVIAAPALWWAARRTRVAPPPHVRAARLIAALGAVWFVFSAIALHQLILLPRYYMVPAYCFFVVAGIWAATALWPQRRRLILAATAVVVAANLLALYVDNKNPMFGARAIVEFLKSADGIVYTDPMTRARMEWYCHWAGVDCDRVKAAPPEPGRVFAYNPKLADQPNRFVPPEKVAAYRPDRAWPVVWEKRDEPTVLGVLLDRAGALALLPAYIARKLEGANPAVRIYRVPG